MKWLIDEDVLARARRLEVPFNRHGIDPFGVSLNDVALMMTVFSWLYHRYFHITVSGSEHVPARGRAMIVGNHSGGWALDGMMVMASMFFEKEPPRLAQGMVDKFMNRLPFASLYTSRTGNFPGTPENAIKLLESDRLLMIFPEGTRGTAKLYGDRHTLVRFGSGFMRLALQTGTPIIPFAFLGGGDAVPTVLNLYRLGKFLGVPYVPITSYLLPIPRRVPLDIYYGEPMEFAGTGNEEDHVIQANVDQVKARIQGLIDQGYRTRQEPTP